MAADVVVAVLLTLGYVVAAAVVGIGLIAAVVVFVVLPRIARDTLVYNPPLAGRPRSRRWWFVAGVALIVAIAAAITLAGCGVVVVYHRAEQSPSHEELPPPGPEDAGVP